MTQRDRDRLVVLKKAQKRHITQKQAKMSLRDIGSDESRPDMRLL
jgi:hypothetical protein